MDILLAIQISDSCSVGFHVSKMRLYDTHIVNKLKTSHLIHHRILTWMNTLIGHLTLESIRRVLHRNEQRTHVERILPSSNSLVSLLLYIPYDHMIGFIHCSSRTKFHSTIFFKWFHIIFWRRLAEGKCTIVEGEEVEEDKIMEYDMHEDNGGEEHQEDDDDPIEVDKDIEDCGFENLHQTKSGDGGTKQGHDDRETQAKDENIDGEDENELRLMVRTLWKTGLEVFIHQLLYRRRVYPRDTFCSTRFVGVDCKINNNPGVLIYIADTLKEMIPLMFGDEGGDQRNNPVRCRLREISIEVYDQSTEITQEKFSLFFSSPSDRAGSIEQDMMPAGLGSLFSDSVPHSGRKAGFSEDVIGEVERDLRDLVCSTGKLERPKSLVWNDSVSFKIVLKLHQRAHDESIAPLYRGLDDRKWSKTSPATSDLTGNRVLFNLANFACQFQYQLTSTKQDKNAS